MEWVAIFRIRYQRGNSHINFITDMIQLTAYFTIFVMGAEKLGIEIPGWLILFVPGLPIIFYILGWWDEMKGMMKFEARYSTTTINPFFKQLEKDVMEIKAALGIKKKKS